MAKNFGKIALFSTLAGAAAAGTYYLLQKKNETPNKDVDDIDDFDDFDDTFDEEFESSPKSKNRAYVSLDLENAKEIVSENVIKAIDKTKEIITDFNVPEKLDKAKEFVEELAFSQDKNVPDEPVYTTVYGDDDTKESTDTDAVDENEDLDADEAESEEFSFTEE